MGSEKFIGFSRRAWGYLLSVVGGLLLLLSMATPETVALVLAPVVELADALGWTIDPDYQDRARRAILALATIVGLVSLARSKMAPDGASLAAVPPSLRRFTG